MSQEAATQRRAIDFAKKHDVDVIRLVFKPGATAGWPDVLFLIPGGRPLFIEFKAPSKTATPLQNFKIGLLKGAGYDVHVCDDFNKASEVIARALVAARVPKARKQVPAK